MRGAVSRWSGRRGRWNPALRISEASSSALVTVRGDGEDGAAAPGEVPVDAGEHLPGAAQGRRQGPGWHGTRPPRARFPSIECPDARPEFEKARASRADRPSSSISSGSSGGVGVGGRARAPSRRSRRGATAWRVARAGRPGPGRAAPARRGAPERRCRSPSATAAARTGSIVDAQRRQHLGTPARSTAAASAEPPPRPAPCGHGFAQPDAGSRGDVRRVIAVLGRRGR